MTLEHPYKGVYLDQQFRSGLHARHRNGHARRRRPQATRMARHTSWIERLIALALLVAAACSLLLAVLMVVGVIWLIGQVVQEIAREWRGW